MKKIKKFLVLLAVSVCSLSILSGCMLFELNEDRYRNQIAFTVGTEEATLGQWIDYFEANAYESLASGSMTVQMAWDTYYPQFIMQKMMSVEYKNSVAASAQNTSALAKTYEDGKYLTDAEIEFVQKSVVASLLESLSSLTMDEIEEDFTLEAEETFAARPEMNEDLDTPYEEDVKLDTEAVDEILAEYNVQDYKTPNFVFEAGDAKLVEIVKDLNDRLEKEESTDPDITEADYIKAQKAALSTSTKNIKNGRNMTMEEYLEYSIEEQLDLQLSTNYLNSLYKKASDSITEEMFEKRYEDQKAQAINNFNGTSAAFETFILGLSATSFVFDVPTEYQGDFSYVKGLLIPFSTEQTEALNSAKTLYGEGSTEYNDFRDDLAAKIEVKEYSKDNLEGTVSTTTTIADVLVNGKMDGIALSSMTEEKFVEMIYKYGTDPGMQNPTHNYVIAKDASDLTVSNEKFVAEFADAAREVANNPSQKYSVCVNDFGVHIVWYVGEVVADTISWDERENYGTEGGSASYRFFSAIYETEKNLYANQVLEALMLEYEKGENDKSITVHENVLKMFFDEYGITYPKPETETE